MRVVALIMATLLSTACAANPPAEAKQPATIQDAAAAIQAAQTAQAKADAVGYEWRDTSPLIQDAQKALGAKEYDKAVELANEARKYAELSYQQYEVESQKTPGLH